MFWTNITRKFSSLLAREVFSYHWPRKVFSRFSLRKVFPYYWPKKIFPYCRLRQFFLLVGIRKNDLFGGRLLHNVFSLLALGSFPSLLAQEKVSQFGGILLEIFFLIDVGKFFLYGALGKREIVFLLLAQESFYFLLALESFSFLFSQATFPSSQFRKFFPYYWPRKVFPFCWPK